VAATTGFPGSFPYTLALDYGAATEELVSVTGAAGTTLTVTRGYGGTSAQSHSLGAVVRHVYDATDATAFRTHEAATAAIHGVAGTLVGTSDTQTLSNKTLTSPTINSGALAGTFTGAPTFTGGATWSGASVLVERALATDNAYRARLTGDANSRFIVNADGKALWGPGTASTDTNLYRSAVGTLTTDGVLTVGGELRPGNLIRSSRANANDSLIEGRVTGDSSARWFVDESGMTWWGSGSAVQDTNLYRSAANTLKTDDNLIVGLGLTVSGSISANNLLIVSDWTSPTLFTGYTGDGNNNGTVQYRVIAFLGTTFVQWRGGLNVGYISGSPINGGNFLNAALPASARPASMRTCPVACSGASSTSLAMKVDFKTDGTVSIVNQTGDTPPWISLNNVMYSL
jgi:hypothetical protein